MLKGLTPKFMSKFLGPFYIVERVFKDVYKLELPPEIKVHPTFHVKLLKLFKEYTIWTGRKKIIRPPPDLLGHHLEYKVEGICKCENLMQKKMFGEIARILERFEEIKAKFSNKENRRH